MRVGLLGCLGCGGLVLVLVLLEEGRVGRGIGWGWVMCSVQKLGLCRREN